MHDHWGQGEDEFYVDPDYEVNSQIAFLYGMDQETKLRNEYFLIPGLLSIKKIDTDSVNDSLSWLDRQIPWKQCYVLDLKEILGRDVGSPINLLNLGLLSIRLLKPGSVYFGPIITYTEDKSTRSISNFEKSPKPSTFFNMLSLDKNDKKELVKIVNGLTKLVSDNSGHLRISFNRFSKAFTNRNMEDKLIDLCIAFEDLLFKGEFKKSKAPMGVILGNICSNVIGGKKEDRKTIRTHIQAVYDFRNKIVHGGEVQQFELWDAVPRFENYYMQSLRKII